MGLPLDWEIPASIRSRISDRLGRQRVIAESGHLLLILHKVPVGTEPARQAVAYWRDPQGHWASTLGGEALAKLTAHIGEYERRVDQLEAEYEAATGAETWFAVLQNVAPLHRAASNLHAALQAAREAVPDDRHILAQRDRAVDIERAVELLHHDVKNAIDYAVARQAEEQARLTYQLTRAGHRLSMLAAIFFPLTALGALFGMNLRSGLEDRPPLVFWGVLLAALGLGGFIFATVIGGAPRRKDERRPTRPAGEHKAIARSRPPKG